MGRLTTHVLDTMAGAPAAGLTIELWAIADSGWRQLSTVITNADGRVDGPLLEGESLVTGQYELRFQAGAYLRGRDVTLAELVVTRSSPLVGRSVREAMARALPGAAMMAVERQGSHLRTGIADLLLRAGDTLLIQTEAARLPDLRPPLGVQPTLIAIPSQSMRASASVRGIPFSSSGQMVAPRIRFFPAAGTAS